MLTNLILILVKIFIEIIFIILPLLIAVAYMTLYERKILAVLQRRRGPNVTGPVGLLQPLADGLKLLGKESILPNNANIFIYVLAPALTFLLSILNWAVMPFAPNIVLADIHLGLIYILLISTLNVHTIIMAGWSSNSTYSFLGSLRSASQMISYDLPLSFIFLSLGLTSDTYNLIDIIELQDQNLWNCFIHPPLFLLFLFCGLAETNRHPFDLPEAESELVSGYNVEYSSMQFAFFFLGEYMNILFMSALISALFLGGWSMPFTNNFGFIPSSFWFALKIISLITFFIYVRGILPRYRYDQLMQIGWRVFLPLTLGWFIFTLSIYNLISINFFSL